MFLSIHINILIYRKGDGKTLFVYIQNHKNIPIFNIETVALTIFSNYIQNEKKIKKNQNWVQTNAVDINSHTH